MNPFPIIPARPLGDRFRDDLPSQLGQERPSSSISKVKGIVLERIGLSGSRSALLPTATAPRVLVDLLSAFSISALQQDGRFQAHELMPLHRHVKQKKSRKASLKKEAPIGLKRRGSYPLFHGGSLINPFNALMQFILFLPGLSDLFFFAPKSFHPFQDFIDHYREEQHENKAISSANTLSLIRCVMKNLPPHLFRGEFNFYEILQILIRSLFPAFPTQLASSAKSYFPDSIAFHPEWQVVWDVKSGKTLEEAIQLKWDEKAPELLISIEGVEETSCNLIKKQFFTPSDWFCYDLDAFIEMRPDKGSTSYVAYLKIDGGWYQCDDDRISHLRSNSLNVPLCRSLLLHYKRIEFGRPEWENARSLS